MTEQEVSVRLTENDERLYACAKRLEAVERRQDALDKLVTAGGGGGKVKEKNFFKRYRG